MEEFKRSVCQLVFEVTNVQLNSVREMETGYLLSHLLRQIDPCYFEQGTVYDDWDETRTVLAGYLSQKGLNPNALCLEVEEICLGSVEALLSGVLQVLTVLFYFNPLKRKGLNALLADQPKKGLKKALETMQDQFEERLNNGPTTARASQEGKTIKTILLKLEQKESELEELQAKLGRVQEKYALSKAKAQEGQQALEERNKQLAETEHAKEQLKRQLEELIKSTRIPNEAFFLEKLRLKEEELDRANRKLLSLQTQLIEREERLSKRETQLAVAQEKNEGVREVEEQLGVYQSLSSSYKAQTEELQSQLRKAEERIAASGANDRLSGELVRAREDFQVQSELLFQTQNALTATRKKLEVSEEKLKKISHRSISNLEHHVQVVNYISRIKELEERSQALEQVATDLGSRLDVGDIQQLLKSAIRKKGGTGAAELKEGPGQELPAQPLREQSRFATCDNSRLRREKSSIEELSRPKGKLGCAQSGQALRKDKENVEEESLGTNRTLLRHREEDVAVEESASSMLYSALMSYASEELNKDCSYFGQTDARKRDILKHFSLSSYVKMV